MSLMALLLKDESDHALQIASLEFSTFIGLRDVQFERLASFFGEPMSARDGIDECAETYQRV